MNGTINMFLHQIVRDRAVPLSLSLSTEQSVYADLLHARVERSSGFHGTGPEIVALGLLQVERLHQVKGTVLVRVNQHTLNGQLLFRSEKTQQHIKGAKGSRFRPTAFFLMKKLFFLQIKVQQHLDQPGSQMSRSVRLRVPSCQENSPHHHRSIRSSCRQHTVLPSDCSPCPGPGRFR